MTGLDGEFCSIIESIVSALVDTGAYRNPNFRANPNDLRRHLNKCAMAVFDAKLEQYGTTIEEDEALLASPDTTGRRRMAIQIRLGEKKLLHEAKAVVDPQLANLANHLGTSEPSAKRRKI